MGKARAGAGLLFGAGTPGWGMDDVKEPRVIIAIGEPVGKHVGWGGDRALSLMTFHADRCTSTSSVRTVKLIANAPGKSSPARGGGPREAWWRGSYVRALRQDQSPLRQPPSPRLRRLPPPRKRGGSIPPRTTPLRRERPPQPGFTSNF